MNFVSEEELKKEREAAGEQPESSEPVDNRTLFHRLKEQRDIKQLEYDETHALKNQFRGIDDGEADFLTQVDRAMAAQEARKRKEEQELLQLSRQQTTTVGEPLPPPLHLEKPQKASAPSSSGHKRQAALVASLVRKRPISTDNDQKPSKHGQVPSSDDSSTSSIDSGISPPKQCKESHCKLVGVLPGLPNYSDSSDEAGSSSNSESLESDLPCVAIYKRAPKHPQGNGGGC